MGSAEADDFVGSDGYDSVSYADADEGVTVDMQDPDAGTGDAAGDTFSDIEALEGSSHNDVFKADDTGNQLFNGAGDDFAYGRGGDDSIFGEDGNDRLFGNEGHDLLVGGLGADRLYGHDGFDSLYGAEGDDLLFGHGGNDHLVGNEGENRLFGHDGYDHLFGGEDRDSLYGGQGDDRLYGGEGDDILRAQHGNDTLFGDGGNDFLVGGVGDDTYDFSRNFGHDKVDNRGDVEDYDTAVVHNVTYEASLLSRDGADLLLRLSEDNSITFTNYFDGNSAALSAHAVDAIEFSYSISAHNVTLDHDHHDILNLL